MLTFLIGENSFEVERTLSNIVDEYSGDVERIDGSQLTVDRLPDLFMGQSLFSNKRLIVIKNSSVSGVVWAKLADYLEAELASHIVVVEPKPDKRTKTYKLLREYADTKEFPVWGERDTHRAEEWATNEARARNIAVDQAAIRALVARTGVDQWRLHHALEKLAVLDSVSVETVESTIENNPSDNVFQLFETALNGNMKRLQSMIHVLKQTEDAYMVFGLLSGQAFQLTALVVGSEPSAVVAKDLGAHPFVLSKLAPYAKRLSQSDARNIISIFAECDDAMKSSATDPWLLVERALLKISRF